MSGINSESLERTYNNHSRIWPTIKFGPNRIVSSMRYIWKWPVLNTTLFVPPGTFAVLTLCDGQRKVFTQGRYDLGREIPFGQYPLQYVDARLRRTSVSLIETLCQDGWRGSLALQISWSVSNAARVVDVKDPIGDLVAAAEAHVQAVIETTPHDTLIAGMGENVMHANKLATDIAERLKHAVPGIRVSQVFITDRKGDERRINIMQEKEVEKTHVIEEQKLKRQKFVSEAGLVTQRMELEHKRQNLVLLEAETKRKQVEEQRKVRIREAEIESEVKRRLMPTKWQEMQLEMAAETTQQRHEQTMEIIKAYGQVLSETAKLGQLETWGISSRRRPEFELGSIEATLSQGLEDLKTVLHQPLPLSSPTPRIQTNGNGTLLMRIAAEISEISSLRGVQACRLEVGTEKEPCRVVIKLQNRILGITCPPEYPDVAPKVQWADNGHQQISIAWTGGMSLKHILQELADTVQDQPVDTQKGH